MYWSDWGTDRIQRSNLDGSEIEDLVATGLNEPYGLALDLGEGKIYWTDWGSDRIQRANLDGSEIEDLVTGLNQPRGIALDLSEDGRMYWPDWGTDKIQRANLDGSECGRPGHRGPEDLPGDRPRPGQKARCTGPTTAPTRSSGPTSTAARSRIWSLPA